MSEIAVAVIGVVGTVMVSLLGVYVSKRYKIGPANDKLISTLQDIVNAQDMKIVQLQSAVEEGNRLIAQLTLEVEELRELSVNQAILIQQLNKKLHEKVG